MKIENISVEPTTDSFYSRMLIEEEIFAKEKVKALNSYHIQLNQITSMTRYF